MRKTLALMTAVVVLICAQGSRGQILIKGTVMDSLSSAAISGVSVLLNGTGANTTTDAQGKFTLTNAVSVNGYAGRKVNRSIGPGYTMKIFSQCGEVVRMYKGAESVTWPGLANGIYIIEIERNGIKRVYKAVRMDAGAMSGNRVSIGDRDEKTVQRLLKSAKVAASSDTVVASKSGYNGKRQAVTLGDTNVVIKMNRMAPVLTLTGTTISWPAIPGATDYHYAISNGPRSDTGRTTTYGDLGNVTSWTPPTASGQTLYYGIEDVTHGVWSTNEVSITWPGTTMPKVYGVNAWSSGAWAISGGLDAIKSALHPNGDRIEWMSYAGNGYTELDNSMVGLAQRGAYLTLVVNRGHQGDIGAIAQHYGPGGAWAQANPSLASYTLRYIEIENESYGDWWSGYDNWPEDYGDRVATAVTAAYNGNPNVLVYPNLVSPRELNPDCSGCPNTDVHLNRGGTWISAQSWNDRVLSRIPDLFNHPNVGGVVAHYYGSASDPSAATLLKLVDALNNWMNSKTGGPGHKIIITEINMINPCPTSWNENDFVTGLPALVHGVATRSYVQGMWFFTLRGYDQPSGCQGFWDYSNRGSGYDAPRQSRIDATRAAIDAP